MTQQSHYWAYIWKRWKLIQNDTCTSMFIGALFTTTKTWKQPKCPLIDKWIKKIKYTYTMEYCCSVAQSCLILCNPMDCSTPGLPVPHHLPESVQDYVHCIGDAIQPTHPLTPSSPSALDLSQYQGFFQWVDCLHQMPKILDIQLQPQSFFQQIFRVDFS